MANVKISGLPEASAGTVLNTDTIVGVFNGITKKCKLSSINLDLLSGKLYLPQYMTRLGTETRVRSLVSLGGGIVLAGTNPTGQIYRFSEVSL